MPDTGWERYVFIHGLNLNKVAGILAAHRTDEIIGQGIGFQDITADSAAVPHGPAGIFLVGRRVWRRGTVFLYMIVGIGEAGRLFIHDFCFLHLADDNHMGPHIQCGDDPACKTGADTLGGIWVMKAVPSLGQAVILVYIPAALETEPLNQVHVHVV